MLPQEEEISQTFRGNRRPIGQERILPPGTGTAEPGAPPGHGTGSVTFIHQEERLNYPPQRLDNGKVMGRFRRRG
jgi:hypothetical protein